MMRTALDVEAASPPSGNGAMAECLKVKRLCIIGAVLILLGIIDLVTKIALDVDLRGYVTETAGILKNALEKGGGLTSSNVFILYCYRLWHRLYCARGNWYC